MRPKILAYAGSLREGSMNRKLLGVGVEAARSAGADVTVIELRDYPLPLFDLELEASEGLHPSARKLKDLYLAHHGLLLACPEHNSSYPALVKNIIDWVSRPATMPDGSPEPPHACTTDKVVGLLSASPGALGGIRMLPELRRVLSNINCLVIPQQFGLAKAHEAFDERGGMKDPKAAAMARGVGEALARACAKMHGANK